MKTKITGLLKGRITRWGTLALVLAAAGLCLAGMDRHHYRLGGAFVGGHPGFMWSLVQIPLDPEGQTEAFRVEPLVWGDDVAGLLTAFGADNLTAAVGEGRMISHDTAKWTCFAYAQKKGNPPTTTAVLVYSGTLKYLSHDAAVINYTVTVHPLSTDGYSPDLTVTLYGPTPVITDGVKRVPNP